VAIDRHQPGERALLLMRFVRDRISNPTAFEDIESAYTDLTRDVYSNAANVRPMRKISMKPTSSVQNIIVATSGEANTAVHSPRASPGKEKTRRIGRDSIQPASQPVS